jgi:hypothetical protein
MDFIARNYFTYRVQTPTYATKKLMEILLNVLQCHHMFLLTKKHVVLTSTFSVTKKTDLKLRRCTVDFDLTETSRYRLVNLLRH